MKLKRKYQSATFKPCLGLSNFVTKGLPVGFIREVVSREGGLFKTK